MAAQPGGLQSTWWLEQVAESPLSLSWWVGSRVPEEDTASCSFPGTYVLQLGPSPTFHSLHLMNPITGSQLRNLTV